MSGTELLSSTGSAILVIDMQEAFRPYVPVFDSIVERAAILLQGARILGVPIAATEQYPKGLGATVEALRMAAGDEFQAIPKLEFAAPAAPTWSELPAVVRDTRQFVLVGIEAHVCVRQTALALLAHGRDVHVCVDAVASARDLHRDVALRELARAGARETTVEQALFDWLQRAGNDEFTAIQRLITS